MLRGEIKTRNKMTRGQRWPCITHDYHTSFESVGLSVQEKKFKINFQDGGHGGHLGFTIRTILCNFDLHITSMEHMKF